MYDLRAPIHVRLNWAVLMGDLLLSDERVIPGRGQALRSVGLPWRDSLVGLGAFLAVGALAYSDGGYHPDAWGWSALPLLWGAAVGLVVRSQVRLGVLERAMLAGLAGLAAWVGLSTLWSDDVSQTALEAQRTLLYPAAALA